MEARCRQRAFKEGGQIGRVMEDSIFFAHAPSALNADDIRDAGSREQPNTPHVKDLPGLAGANSLKQL